MKASKNPMKIRKSSNPMDRKRAAERKIWSRMSDQDFVGKDREDAKVQEHDLYESLGYRFW